MSFYAYSPLGGGILTGKYAFEQEKEKSIITGRNGTLSGIPRQFSEPIIFKFLRQNILGRKRFKIF
jgi:hypothetical protein